LNQAVHDVLNRSLDHLKMKGTQVQIASYVMIHFEGYRMKNNRILDLLDIEHPK
jgi:hypothetical protein